MHPMASYREALLQSDRALMTTLIRKARTKAEGQQRDRRTYFPHVRCSICQRSVRKTKEGRIAVHFYKDSTGERVRCEWSRRLVE